MLEPHSAVSRVHISQDLKEEIQFSVWSNNKYDTSSSGQAHLLWWLSVAPVEANKGPNTPNADSDRKKELNTNWKRRIYGSNLNPIWFLYFFPIAIKFKPNVLLYYIFFSPHNLKKIGVYYQIFTTNNEHNNITKGSTLAPNVALAAKLCKKEKIN